MARPGLPRGSSAASTAGSTTGSTPSTSHRVRPVASARPPRAHPDSNAPTVVLRKITHSTTSFGYSAPLDGLRAFAVASVVLFHFGVPGVNGGFLGVDTFFVLSGFLITSLLLAENLRDGRIKLSQFWVRRARRLMPALLTMLVGVLVAGHYLLDSDDLKLLRTDTLSALFYIANWRMIWRGTGYTAATATAQGTPLQHTWSLGIEEQFYLLWPLLVAGLLAWLAAKRTRRALLAICAAGIATSELLCASFYNPDSWDRSYFGTDTRAQALLVGAALAAILTPVRPGPDPQKAQPVARPGRHPILGVLAVAGAGVTIWMWDTANDAASWMYRGGLTLAAAATALLILHAVVSPKSPTARILALPPLVFLGKISYGVYLYHWPIFCFVNADDTGLSRWPLLGVRLLATMAISVTSYYLIEQPIRRGGLVRLLPKRAPIGVTVTAFGVVIVATVLATAPPPAPPPSAEPVITTSISPIPSVSAAGAIVPMDRPGRKALSTGSEPRIDFFGDSVSWVIGSYLPKHPGLWVGVRAIEGCGIATLPDILELGTPHTNYQGCTNWPARWQKGVDTDDPDVAVIELNRWELMDRKLNGVYQHVGEPQYDAYLMGLLDKAVSIAGSHGAAVVLLTAAYTHRAEKPDGSLYPEDQPARVDAWNKLIYAEAAKHPSQITVLNILPIVCPDGKFTWDIGNLKIRSDGLHYTVAGVQKIIAPWLLPKLASIAAGTYQVPGQINR